MSMPSYQATHVVPPGGLQAWSTPDPAVAPVDKLDAGLDVQVVQRYGAWAQIQCSNGWMCWVDGEALQLFGTPSPATVAYTPHTTFAAPVSAPASSLVAPFSIVAGVLVALSTFLPWFSFAGIDLNAFKIPLDFLTSGEAPATDDAQLNSIGGLMLVIGLATVATAFLRNRNARRTVGAVVGMVSLDYVFQLYRSISDTPDAPSIFSVIGFGVYICIIGGALAFLDFRSTA